MEKETITDNLEKLLIAIHRQVVVIRDTEQQIPKTDMDKALSNIRSLYEQFVVLNYINENPIEKPAPPQRNVYSPFEPIVEKQPEPVIPKPQLEDQPQHTPAPVVNERVYTEPQIEHKPVVHEPAPAKKEEPVAPSTQPDVEPVKPIIQAQVKETKPTGDSQRLGDMLRQQRIDDIHKAITLSDKFLFMNELFEAENTAYKEAIDMLNRLTSLQEAAHYMDSLAARYRWYDHAKTEKKFRDLVARKFA